MRYAQRLSKFMRIGGQNVGFSSRRAASTSTYLQVRKRMVNADCDLALPTPVSPNEQPALGQIDSQMNPNMGGNYSIM